MSISIQTNVNSLVAQENLATNNAFQSKTIERLTSGYDINSSGDDAAGLAVANQYRSSVAELTQGVKNANNGVAQLQIMDSGMSNISTMLDRLKTLATESASSTFTGDRDTLNSEFSTLIDEVDRQAQAIGLDTGGTFAKDLSVYIGGGSGATSASTLANSTVSVDLSSATVDSESLGLKGVTASNSSTYDLGTSSTTSVANIVADSTNKASETNSGYTQFTFYGSGFSNDSTGANSGVTITVNTSGVSDGATLATAINDAISTAEGLSTSAASEFKAAGISASIVTDSSGNEKLAFSSSSSAFEVKADDLMSSALMGNLSTGTTGALTATATTTGAVAITTGAAGTAGTYSMKITGGVAGTTGITLSVAITDTSTAASVLADVQTALSTQDPTVTASLDSSNKLIFTSTAGAVTVDTTTTATATGATALATALSTSTATSASQGYQTYVASGSYELGSTSSTGTASANDLGFTALTSGTQSIGISANDSSGTSHTLSVTLTSGTTGSTIDKAVAEINKELQASNDSTLQQITAVAVNDNGTQKINLISTVSDFSVAIGTTSSTTGITTSAGTQGKTVDSDQIGTASSLDISTEAGATAAITAISEAVSKLGLAQGAVGKGENVLGYAVDLASSQITNYDSAQSAIRDADIATEAANLSKAQTLQQATIAAMAQANTAPQAVLSLLKS